VNNFEGLDKYREDDLKTEDEIMDTFLDAILDRIESDKKNGLIPKGKEN